MEILTNKINYCEEHYSSYMSNFAAEVEKGLSGKNKYLSCKYIYDDTGSALFRKIMKLPEYYLTGCETEILHDIKGDIADIIDNTLFNLIELGAGDGEKTKILLEHFLHKKLKFHYIAIDISDKAVNDLIFNLSRYFTGLRSFGLVAEYFSGLNYLSAMDNTPKLILFLGSNIGNMSPEDADEFLGKLRESLNHGDYILIGFDMKKDIQILLNAYNDNQGITAEFNKNLLYRINKELGGEFDVDSFSYYSTYDVYRGAVNSFLISKYKHEVYVKAIDKVFHFNQWEGINTESSYKYDQEDIENMASKNGYEILNNYFSNNKFFTDSLWKVIKK